MIIDELKQLQSNQTDQEFAEQLGIHRVSWQRIKNRRVPVSDKFLMRVHRAFPELDVFLTFDATPSKQRVTEDITIPSQNAQDGKLGRFRGWLRGFINRTKELLQNSREP